MFVRNSIISLPQTEDQVATFDWAAFASRFDSKRRSFSVIDECTYISGKYVTRDAFIHGQIEGLVFAENITVEKTAHIRGVVFCRTIIVMGKVTADIICDSILIKDSGVLNSTLKYRSLSIAAGGVIAGSFERRKLEIVDATRRNAPPGRRAGNQT